MDMPTAVGCAYMLAAAYTLVHTWQAAWAHSNASAAHERVLYERV